MRLLLLGFLVFLDLGGSQADEGARLLCSKTLLNKYAVEGQDLTVQYTIYNVGSSAALDVELNDDAFHPEQFGIVSGMLNVKWERIPPASNVTHSVVLRPLVPGLFNFSSASISYLPHEGADVVSGSQDNTELTFPQVGHTSFPGQGGILAQKEYDRKFSPHYADWFAFGLFTLPSIGMPLFIWYNSMQRYSAAKQKKN